MKLDKKASGGFYIELNLNHFIFGRGKIMGKRTDFLYLSETDMRKAGVLNSEQCNDISAEVFRLLGTGDYIMGGFKHNEHGFGIEFPKETPFPNMPVAGPDRRFAAMVAYLGGDFNICGEKWYGSNIINPQRGLPRSVLMVMLNDPDTCEPLCLMSANLVSAMRTGAVPGVGARYLARKDAQTCTVIGCGPINKSCIKAIANEAKNLKKLYIHDVFPEKAKEFADWAREELHLEGEIAQSLEDGVRAGDIVSVAASRLKPLELHNEWLKAGATVILSGPAKADQAFWTENKLIFDNAKMHMAYMESATKSEDTDLERVYHTWIGGPVYCLIDQGILPPLTEAVSLGDIVCGARPGRQNDEDKYIFITSGMVVFDLGWGYTIYKKAQEMGLGQVLNLWEEPYWS
jgi:ornithine cyclodeaminase